MAIQDLTASLDLKQNLNIYATCKQYDSLNLILSIYDNSLQADLTNYNVRLRAMKADKVPLIQEHVGITISSNVVTIEADEQLTTTAGKTLVELQFIDNTTGKKKATFNLVLVVVPSTVSIDATISTATYTLLEELENKLEQATDYFENVSAFQTEHPEIMNLDYRVIQNTEQLTEKATKLDSSKTITFYVSPTGLDTNDGLTALVPFGTLQKAFDVIKSAYSVIDGQVVIDLAAGTYEQTANIAGVISRNRIKLIGKTDADGIPTVIFDGTNNTNLPYAISFSDRMNVYIKDIKVQNFANSASRSGIVAQVYTNLWTKNVHAINCGFAGINCDNFVRLYVEGGKVEGNRIGIRGYSNCVVTIGYNNSTQSYLDANRVIIKNNTESGVLVYNMSTGHLDFCEIDGNSVGVTIQNSSRLHLWKNLIKNSIKYGVFVNTSSTWYNDTNTFESNAQNYKQGAFSSELNQNEDYTPISKITPKIFLDSITHTGATGEVYLNTLNANIAYTLLANTFVNKGQKLKIIVNGTFTGAGIKTVRLRIDTGLISGFASVSGSTKNFNLEADLLAVDSGNFKVFSKWLEGNAAYNVLYAPRTAVLSSNRTITVSGELSDATGSIIIESFEIREIV